MTERHPAREQLTAKAVYKIPFCVRSPEPRPREPNFDSRGTSMDIGACLAVTRADPTGLHPVR